MKKLTLTLGLLAFSISILFAQTLEWKKNPFSNSTSSEIKQVNATRFGPDGKIYSIGSFPGFRINFDGVVLKADSLGFISYINQSGSTPGVFIPETVFLSCHESNGTLAWVKTISSTDNIYNHYADVNGSTIGGRNTLSFDSQGNILVAGTLPGDTLSFDGVPFTFNSQPFTVWPYRIFVLKISPTGSLIWGRSELSKWFNGPLPVGRHISERNGIVEAYFSAFDTTGSGEVLMRTQANGTALPTLKSTFPESQFFSHSSLVRLSNGNFIRGLSGFPGGGFMPRSMFSSVNGDLTGLNNVQVTSNGTADFCHVNSVVELPDGQLGAFITPRIFLNNFTNLLIWGNDTLNVVNSATGKSMFVRLSSSDCMKKVVVLDFHSNGTNCTTPNGNILTLNHSFLPDQGAQLDPSLEIKMLDRNGAIQSGLPLGDLGLSWGVREFFTISHSSNRHFLDYKNGSVVGCYGQYIFKASFPDPIVSDQSFAGCLSNRDLLLSTEKALSAQSMNVFEKEPGQWQVQTTAGTQAEIHLVSMLGQRLQTLKMENGMAAFSSKGLPGGMYLLQSASKNGAETQRFVVK